MAQRWLRGNDTAGVERGAPTESVREYLGDFEMVQNTGNTLVKQSEIERDLVETRKRGYAIDDEEFAVGVTCFSAAIFDRAGFPRFSLTTSVPTARLRDLHRNLVAHVVESAAKASRGLGYRGPLPSETVSTLVPTAVMGSTVQ